MSSESKPALSPKRRLFVQNYTDKDSPTFGNGTQSYLQAYPNSQISTAGTEAHRLLQNPQIQNEVQSVLNDIGRDYNVRLKEIDAIASGYTIVSETIGPDGKVTTVKKPVSPRERLDAHKYLLRLTGEEDRSRATGKIINDRLVKLSKQMLDNTLSGGNGGSGETGGMGGKGGVDTSIPSPFDSPDTKTHGHFDPWGDTYDS